MDISPPQGINPAPLYAVFGSVRLTFYRHPASLFHKIKMNLYRYTAPVPRHILMDDNLPDEQMQHLPASSLMSAYCLISEIHFELSSCSLSVPSRRPRIISVMPDFVSVQLPTIFLIILILSIPCNCPVAVHGYGLIGGAVSVCC